MKDIEHGLKRQLFIVFTLTLWPVLCSSRTVFNFEQIDKAEFDRAFENRHKFHKHTLNDSVEVNEITLSILDDVKDFVERREPEIKQNLVDEILGAEQYDKWLSLQSMSYSSELGIYCFEVPHIHDSSLLVYDSVTGAYLGEMLAPFTISPKGIFVSQTGFDCDWFIDFHFYKIGNRYVRNFLDYRNFNIHTDQYWDYEDAVAIFQEYFGGDPSNFSFWGNDDDLYLSAPDFNTEISPGAYATSYYKFTIVYDE